MNQDTWDNVVTTMQIGEKYRESTSPVVPLPTESKTLRAVPDKKNDFSSTGEDCMDVFAPTNANHLSPERMEKTNVFSF